MDVSVIIVNYNTRDVTSNCIESIFKHTVGVDFEVIVVDNASSDGSAELFDADRRIRFIGNSENAGFGRANNLGIEAAKGEYLFFLNSDTLLLNNAIGRFYDFAASSLRKVGVLGAILKSPEGRNIHSYGDFITPSGLLCESLNGYTKTVGVRVAKRACNAPDNVCGEQPVDYVTGADMFVPRNVIDEAGGFDSRFFMYCEEVDLQKRIADKGYERLIIDGPEIIHLEGVSYAETSGSAKQFFRSYHLLKSKMEYMRIHYGGTVKYYAFRTIYYIFTAPKIPFMKYSGKEKKLYYKALLS